MSVYDNHLARYNFPPYSASPEVIKNILSTNGGYKVIIADSIGGNLQNIAGLLVEESFIEQGIDVPYLNKSIAGYRVFAPKVGGTLGIPCHTPVPFLVQKDGEIPEDKADYNYKEILFTDEIIIADIYKNAWKYRFDDYLDAYVRLPEQGAKQQLAKQLLAKEIANMSGSPYDRLADYGRIILFLLSKITLTELERAQLAPLLAYAPVLSEINEVIYREEQIQEKIQQMKENTDEYLGISG